MSTKFLRFSKSSLSIVLSVMMIVSTVLVGSSVTVDVDEQTSVTFADTQAVSNSVDEQEIIDSAVEEQEDTASSETQDNNEADDTQKSDISATDKKTSKSVQASTATVEAQTSGAGTESCYVVGSNLGTSSSDCKARWSTSEGIKLTYDSNTGWYSADVYFAINSELKILHGSDFRGSTSENTEVYSSDSNYAAQKEENNGRYSYIFKSPAGMYKVYYDGDFSKNFRIIAVNETGSWDLRGTDIRTNDGSKTVSWNHQDEFKLTKDSDYEYSINVYIPSNASIKLVYYYNNSDKAWLRCSDNTIDLDDEKNYDSTASGNPTFAGSNGYYTIHYNLLTRKFKITEQASSYTIENKSTDLVSVAETATSGSTVSFTTTPGDGKIAALTITDADGNAVNVIQTNTNTYSFKMPSSNVKISAATVAKTNSCTVKAAVAGGSGKVTGLDEDATYGSNSEKSVAAGTAITLTASVTDSDYPFSKWKVSGTAGTDYYLNTTDLTGTSITIYPINNVTVKAVFTENKGEEQDLYILYGTNDDYIFNNAYKASRVYKKSGSTYPLGNTGYMYYTDIDTSSVSGDFYFLLSSAATASSRYYSNVSNNPGINSKNLTITNTDKIQFVAESKRDKDTKYSWSYKINVSSDTTTIRIYLQGSNSTATTVDGLHFAINPDIAAASANQVTVYAKNGTIRYDGEGGLGRSSGHNFNTFSEKATTTIDYVDILDGDMTENRQSNGLVQVENVEKGKTIRITTKIDSDYKNSFYVKAFCINGDSYGIINEPSVNDTKRTTGTYSFDYTIPLNTKDNVIEITPVYFYFTDNASSNKENKYIIFYAEDFIGEVKEKWGNTISCYAWYSAVEADDYTEGKKPALGGYPGQPMIYEDGSYYMQVPKYLYWEDGTKHLTQGVTMNNYYWDDIHFSYGNYGTLFENCQTYDYDDFVALLAYDDMENIIFSFKYRTVKDNDVSNIGTTTYYLYNGCQKYGNGWNPLVDYYDYSVDIFGNRITYQTTVDDETVTKYYMESDIQDKIDENIDTYFNSNGRTNNTFVYIVSDGYQDEEKSYIGKYATLWNIYDRGGTKITALPPSAFIWDIPSEYLNTDLPTNKVLDGFLGYSDKAIASSNESLRNTLWGRYCDLYNAKDENGNYLYRNIPAVITYEKAISSKGKYVDYGHRCDGRWYFSRKNAKISANIKIQIATADVDGNYTYEYDDIEDGKGKTTGATAYFTNAEFYKAMESGEVTQSSKANFTFLADGTSTNSYNDTYIFKGWYLSTGSGELFPSINKGDELYKVDGKRAMISNATFVARYEKVSTDTTIDNPKTLIISHELYSKATRGDNDPALYNGTGSTKVSSVTITTSSGTTTIDNNSSSLVLTPEQLDGVTSLSITLTTTPADSSTSITDIYYYNEKSNANSKFEANTSTEKTTVTYTLDSNAIAALFPEGTTKATLKYFANLKTTNVTLYVKYYDRSITNNIPTTISKEPVVLTIPITLSDTTDLDETIFNKLKDRGVNKYIDNIVDKYYIWQSQKEASAQIQSMINYRVSGNHAVGQKSVGQKSYAYYSESGFENPDYTLHTDYYGVLQSETDCKIDDEEAWVTYKDASDKLIPYTENEENNIDKGLISTITIWAFNTPKPYAIDVYYPDFDNEQSLDASLEIDADTTLFYNKTSNSKYGVQQGFYNQRLGGNDSTFGTGTGSNAAVDYLKGYGINDAFLGTNIEAEKEVEISDSGKYVFDGWYAYDSESQKPLYKITANNLYGYRITTDLKIVACYQKIAVDEEFKSDVGVTVTNNGVDYYALNGVNKVRLNTQLNVYGADPSDPNIKQVSVIYVILPPTYTDSNGDTKSFTNAETTVLNAVAAQVKKDVETNKLFEKSGMKANVTVSNVTIGNNTRSANYVSYTYDVDWDGTATGSYVAELTNKNRVQFVLNMNVEDYEAGGKYSAVLAFAGINYDFGKYVVDEEDETKQVWNADEKWIVSDNYVSYITNP